MAKTRWPYWGGFAALTVASLGMLFLFIFGFLPQRFVLELDFAESGFAYPVVLPPLPQPPPLSSPAPRRPIARGPAERFWAEYLALAGAGEGSAALSLAEEYLARYPDDWDARLEYGRALWRLGLLDDAIDAYKRALAAGANVEVNRELARLLVAAGRWGDALTLYDTLVDENYTDASLVKEYAEAATWAEHYDLAGDLYAELVERAPGDIELRLAWARVLYWSGETERSAGVLDGLPDGYAGPGVDSLRAAIALALPPPPDLSPEPSRLEQARALMLAGATDSALVLYRAYLNEHPAADTLLLEVADVFEFRADRSDSTIAYLKIYLRRHPEAQDVRLRLARLLAWSGRYGQAELTARAVVEARPRTAEAAQAWVLIGDLNRWEGQPKRAREAYQSALAADPSVRGATEGLSGVDSQVNARLADRGHIGPAGGFDYFADNDEFRLARVRGGWTGGSPRARGGLELALERLEGFGADGARTEMAAGEVRATGETWWMDGGLHVAGSLGVWVPDQAAAAQPTVDLSLSAPDWGGSAYRFEYRHGPAYRETQTMEAAATDLRADVIGLEAFRPVESRWDLSAMARVARISGSGDPNLRGDAALGFLFRPASTWGFGLETRGLAFSDPAPSPAGRPLYWDPEWYWLNAGVVDWFDRPGGWELGVRALVGAAWLGERDRAATVEAQFALNLSALRRVGAWSVGGRAAISQSRADGYRAFRVELEATRGFGF